jgi:hypothetical protein
MDFLAMFSPCTRLFDILNYEEDGEDDAECVDGDDVLQELNLDGSAAGEFLSAETAFTYADLYDTIGNGETVVWFTHLTSVVRTNSRAEQEWMQLHDSRRFCFDADGKEISALACSPEHLLEICDVVLRLLSASVVHSVTLNKNKYGHDAELMNSPALAFLMEKCQSLKVLTLGEIVMDENHCRVLGDYSRTGLEIEMIRCTLTNTGARALGEVLGRNQGPTRLDYCDIDVFVIADGLRGNSRLKSFKQDFSGNLPACNRQLLAIADAVRENKGLVELSLRFYVALMNGETWGAVCDSMKTHPTLEVLDLFPPVAPDVFVISRMQALVDLIKVNTSIHTIYVDSQYSEHEIYQESVVPYLETNRFRPRLLAIQKTRPIAYRAKVLGRALLATRTAANTFWMLLSGNAEVAFPSRTTTIAVVANLPTPATTTTSTSTGFVAAVAALEMPALTTAATGSFPPAAAADAATSATISSTTSATTPSTASTLDAIASAPTVIATAANGATTSVGQKRKACP